MAQKITEKIKSFFAEQKYIENECQVVVFREDGLILYKSDNIDKINGPSLGALMGGTWQAAVALLELDGKNKEDADEYRLSFDSAHSGVYLLFSGDFEGYKLYLGSIFAKELSPGKLKNNLRKVNYKLRELINECATLKIEDRKSGKETYLFNNITDTEIDNLFSVLEK